LEAENNTRSIALLIQYIRRPPTKWLDVFYAHAGDLVLWSFWPQLVTGLNTGYAFHYIIAACDFQRKCRNKI